MAENPSVINPELGLTEQSESRKTMFRTSGPETDGYMPTFDDVNGEQDPEKAVAVPPVKVAVVDGPHKAVNSDPRFETGNSTLNANGQPQVVQILGKQPLRTRIVFKNLEANAIGIVSSPSQSFGQSYQIAPGAEREFVTSAAMYAINGVATQTVNGLQWFATFKDGGLI